MIHYWITSSAVANSVSARTAQFKLAQNISTGIDSGRVTGTAELDPETALALGSLWGAARIIETPG